MEEDIRKIIQRKIWTIEETLLPLAKELVDKANNLPKNAKKTIPVFSDEWSEGNVKKHLEKLKVAIRDPLRYKNRNLLEDLGLLTKDIPEEIFDNSAAVGELVGLCKKLKQFNEMLTNTLIKKGILSGWLEDGIDKAKERLKEISEAKIAFQRIFEGAINENLRDELIQRSVEDTGFISSAEDIISRVKFINEFGISTEYKVKFDDFQQNVINVNEKLETLQEAHRISKEKISELVRGKLLYEAIQLLEKKLEECSEKKRKLQEDWKMYSTTLESIGCEVPSFPEGLHELEEGVEKLKKKCLNILGDDGIGLLKFLRSEEDFPEEISKEGIKKTLEILRPLFVKFLREEI